MTVILFLIMAMQAPKQTIYASQGRLIDVVCGSIHRGNDGHIAVANAKDCLINNRETKSNGELAIWSDFDRLIRLTPAQQKEAGKWRVLLESGEVRVYVDAKQKIKREGKQHDD